MASERLAPWFSPHLSTAAVSSTGKRTALTGSRPVAGRPRFLWFTLIGLAIKIGLPKLQAEGKLSLPPRLLISHGSSGFKIYHAGAHSSDEFTPSEDSKIIERAVQKITQHL